MKGKDEVKDKGKLSMYKPVRPCGFQEVEDPRLQDSWYMKVLSFVSPTHRSFGKYFWY